VAGYKESAWKSVYDPQQFNSKNEAHNFSHFGSIKCSTFEISQKIFGL